MNRPLDEIILRLSISSGSYTKLHTFPNLCRYALLSLIFGCCQTELLAKTKGQDAQARKQ